MAALNNTYLNMTYQIGSGPLITNTLQLFDNTTCNSIATFITALQTTYPGIVFTLAGYVLNINALNSSNCNINFGTANSILGLPQGQIYSTITITLNPSLFIYTNPSYSPSSTSFLVGSDILPQNIISTDLPIKDINPTQYNLKLYIQYWINKILSPAWETIKTNSGLTDIQISKICQDNNWSYVPFDLIGLTNVNVLPQWNISAVGGHTEAESNELYWIVEEYQVMMIMQPFTDPKFIPFAQLLDTIPRVIYNALKTNVDQGLVNTGVSNGVLFWDKCEIIFGEYSCGPAPLLGKQGLYHCCVLDISIRSQMQTIYSGVNANEVDFTITMPNDGTANANEYSLSGDQLLNNIWSPGFGDNKTTEDANTVKIYAPTWKSF